MSRVIVASLSNPLQRPPWNHSWKVIPITHEEIQQALQDPALDEAHTWRKNCRSWTREEASSRKNHVYRIAYFVKHRDAAAPITLTSRGRVFDGSHRLAAAVYCGDEFISIEGAV